MPAHHRAHVGIAVHRIDQFDVAFVFAGQFGQTLADGFEGAAEALAPVRGDQHHAPAVERDAVQGGTGQFEGALRHIQEGVDDRIAGDRNRRIRKALIQEVLTGLAAMGEEQVGHRVDHPAVGFFRIGMVFVECAQARFHVADLHARVEGRQGRRHGGGGVALHQQQVELLLPQDLAHLRQHGGGDVLQGLVFSHQVELIVGADAEQFDQRRHHVLVLAGQAIAVFDQPRVAFQFGDQGGHLDGLGACPEDGENADGGVRHGRPPDPVSSSRHPGSTWCPN